MKNIQEKPYFKYSIIVPSYNRQEEIRELLDSFQLLDFPPNRLELIIADDGSSDETEKIVRSYQKKMSFNLHFFSQKNQGPGAARNMGIMKASGDFFVFVDSDCTVPPDWLKKVEIGLQAQNAAAFGGRDSYREDFPDLLKAINYSMTSFFTTGGLRGGKGKKLAKFYPRSFNMGISRELFKKVGGFGTLRHGQDIEYSNRIIKSGAKVAYIDNAIVYHKRRTSIRKFFRQVFNWGVARINLYKIDSSMLEPLHTIPAIATLLLLLIIMLSILFQPLFQITKWIFFFAIAIIIISTIHATLRYRSWRMLYFIPIIIPIQILGYGMGFLFAFSYRVILRKPEYTGFRKKYYK